MSDDVMSVMEMFPFESVYLLDLEVDLLVQVDWLLLKKCCVWIQEKELQVKVQFSIHTLMTLRCEIDNPSLGKILR
ncbi:hypothetical protein Patl1_15310 [Pistacia atlantica]|uniref:Uncharacterized protein n=1 Tax=Pistacia atlantica TaxID=434234 RepID=A0ACC1B773_9ROSI|nr:hypothetical protein Patl1_15310 [Pistacia atlantica]